MITPQIEKVPSRNLFERYAWLFMRGSGIILLGLAVFHLIYMQFIIPGGATAIDYDVIAARWADPVWGFFWRFFDLLLLAFGLTHGSNGLRQVLNDYIRHPGRRKVAKFCLGVIFAATLWIGAAIIFTFRATPTSL